MVGASMRVMRTAMASAKSTSIPSKASGPCCAPGCARTAASHRRSCPPTLASFSSSTTPGGGERLCSAPSTLPWSHDPPITTPKPDKSHFINPRVKELTARDRALRNAALTDVAHSDGAYVREASGGNNNVHDRRSPTPRSRSGQRCHPTGPGDCAPAPLGGRAPAPSGGVLRGERRHPVVDAADVLHCPDRGRGVRPAERARRDRAYRCWHVGWHRRRSGDDHFRVPSRSIRAEDSAEICRAEDGPMSLAWIMHVRSFCATGTLCYQGVSHQVKGPIGTLLIRVY